jgi:hypothetical protein
MQMVCVSGDSSSLSKPKTKTFEFSSSDSARTLSDLFSCQCNKGWKDAMMPSSCCLLLARNTGLAAYLVGECVDAKTSNSIATGED